MDSNYIVLARKYRPSTFAGVVGQKALTQTLKNAITGNRLAQAYLFCGPRGVGKTSCARIFSKTINCTNRTPDGEACGECESCLDFQRGHSYNVVELDAASNNGVDQIRNLIEQVNISPQMGHYRVFIIDEVHMLSAQAFNAFLKTLEEPPSYAIFILATTEKNKVLPTILSRCQIYDFKRITNADIAEHLAYVAEKEHIQADPKALAVIASKADGAMRDALSIFDQMAASSGNNVTYQSALENLNVLDYESYFRFDDAFRKGDVTGVLMFYKEVRDRGFDGQFFVNGLARHLRNLMVAMSEQSLPLLEVPEAIARQYREQASQFKAGWYYKALSLLSDCDLNFRTATDKELLVEITLIKLCQLIEAGESTVNPETPLRSIKADTPAAASSGAPAPPQSAYTQPQSASPAAAMEPAAVHPESKPQVDPQVRSAAPSPAYSANHGAPAAVAHAVRPMAAQHTRNLRLRRQKAAAESQQTPAASAPQHLDPITPEKLASAWNSFIADHPDEKTLLKTMSADMPVPVQGTTYRFTVPGRGQLMELNEKLGEITDYLRRSMGNDAFQLEVVQREVAPSQRYLTPSEFLEKAVADNPSLRDFLSQMDFALDL